MLLSGSGVRGAPADGGFNGCRRSTWQCYLRPSSSSGCAVVPRCSRQDEDFTVISFLAPGAPIALTPWAG